MFSHTVIENVSHLYNTARKITVLCILTYVNLVEKLEDERWFLLLIWFKIRDMFFSEILKKVVSSAAVL
jgi:hypothetical protein